jgi:hypothetical protein
MELRIAILVLAFRDVEHRCLAVGGGGNSAILQFAYLIRIQTWTSHRGFGRRANSIFFGPYGMAVAHTFDYQFLCHIRTHYYEGAKLANLINVQFFLVLSF